MALCGLLLLLGALLPLFMAHFPELLIRAWDSELDWSPTRRLDWIYALLAAFVGLHLLTMAIRGILTYFTASITQGLAQRLGARQADEGGGVAAIRLFPAGEALPGEMVAVGLEGGDDMAQVGRQRRQVHARAGGEDGDAPGLGQRDVARVQRQ